MSRGIVAAQFQHEAPECVAAPDATGSVARERTTTVRQACEV